MEVGLLDTLEEGDQRHKLLKPCVSITHWSARAESAHAECWHQPPAVAQMVGEKKRTSQINVTFQKEMRQWVRRMHDIRKLWERDDDEE